MHSMAFVRGAVGACILGHPELIDDYRRALSTGDDAEFLRLYRIMRRVGSVESKAEDHPADEVRESFASLRGEATPARRPEPKSSIAIKRRNQSIVEAFLYQDKSREAVARLHPGVGVQRISAIASEHRKHGWWTPDGRAYDPEKFRSETGET